MKLCRFCFNGNTNIVSYLIHTGTFVTDADLLELSMLTNLTELRLKNTSITNQGVENLWPLGNHLQSLSLRDCRHIDSWVFPSLANIKSLTFLNLGGTNVDRVQFSPKRNRWDVMENLRSLH